MTIRSRTEAVEAAKKQTTNSPGMCQQVTRLWFNAPSVGDVDRDGDADAVDGWLSEPNSARRYGDTNPPAGVPVSWSGGSRGHGHRAISLGNGMCRSTDAGGRGKVADVSIDWVTRSWGMRYLGWSTTISGQHIPNPQPPKTPKPKVTRISKARAQLETALQLAIRKGWKKRAGKLRAALKALPKR